MQESFDRCPPGWIRQSGKRCSQSIHNHMVVDDLAMSSVKFAMPDFCSAGDPSSPFRAIRSGSSSTLSQQHLNLVKLLSPTHLRQWVNYDRNAYFCNGDCGLPLRFTELNDNSDLVRPLPGN